jgi:hypothetical protein
MFRVSPGGAVAASAVAVATSAAGSVTIAWDKDAMPKVPRRITDDRRTLMFGNTGTGGVTRRLLA